MTGRRSPYFPLIPPEREIRDQTAGVIAAQRGTKAVSRGPGEQYVLTCCCGVLQVTSDTTAPARFERDHANC